MTDETEEAEATDTADAQASKPVTQVNINDVDASWDGIGSLDDHRQAAFAKLKQPAFGRKGVKSDGE